MTLSTNTEAVSELLPCPFCGQDAAEFYERIELKRLCVGVKCGRCGNRTDVRDVNYDGHKNSAEWWNRRSANSAVPVADAAAIIARVQGYDTPTESDPRRRYTPAQLETAIRLSRRSASNTGRVEVKALEWEDCDDLGHCADTIIGRYWIEPDDLATQSFQLRLTTIESEEECSLILARGQVEPATCVTAAQADFNQRILSSLAAEAEPVAPFLWLTKHDASEMMSGMTSNRHITGWRQPTDKQGNELVPLYATPVSSPVSAEVTEAWWPEGPFKFGDRVEKPKGSSWHGKVCGWYTTSLTPLGYCVESEREPGSVQLYPVAALKASINGGRENG